jgi:hypothetical protein
MECTCYVEQPFGIERSKVLTGARRQRVEVGAVQNCGARVKVIDRLGAAEFPLGVGEEIGGAC